MPYAKDKEGTSGGYNTKYLVRSGESVNEALFFVCYVVPNERMIVSVEWEEVAAFHCSD
jgi:hypothetical protein